MMKRFVLLLLILLWTGGLLFSQQPIQGDVSSKVTELEKQIADLKGQLGLYTKFYDEQKGIIDRYNIAVIVLLILGGLGGLGSLVGGFIVLKNALSAEAKKKIEEKFEKIFEEKKALLLKIIKDEEYEEKIKAKKKILILSNKECSFEDELREFFTKYGFKNIDYRRITAKVNYKQYDLILFNNHEKDIPTTEIDAIINQTPKKIAFLCHNPDKQVLESKPQYINFANHLNTLYPRIIELLRYRDTMEEEH